MVVDPNTELQSALPQMRYAIEDSDDREAALKVVGPGIEDLCHEAQSVTEDGKMWEANEEDEKVVRLLPAVLPWP